jgi:glycine hydroxymethyltransferase
VNIEGILKLIEDHEEFRSSCINLVASENVLSKAVKKALGSDLAGRYVARPRFYAGTSYMEEIWSVAEHLAQDVFRSRYALVNPIGGHIALMATLHALVRPGDSIAAIAPEHGGYPGLSQEKSLAELLSLRVEHLPFIRKRYELDTGLSVALIKRVKPKVVVLGASVILFPQPVQDLSEAVHEYGGILVYDGSHVMGLIAGRAFQDPLSEGADVLLGSTHKSFFGPQGGLVLTDNEDLANKISSNFVHVTMDNPHPNRLAALAVALSEAKVHGQAYAKQVISNSRALAEALYEEGIPVTGASDRGYTLSHQVLVDQEGWRNGEDIRDILEKVRIIADSGVRFGTSEITRRGYREKDTQQIAQASSYALAGKTFEALTLVEELVHSHKGLVYC